MNKKYIIVSCVLSSVMSLIAIFISLLRCEPITMDWMGVLVGILSLLVATLLGWQIFTLFNIKRIEDKIKNRHIDIYNKAENSLAEFHMALWVFYTQTKDGKPRNQHDVMFSWLQSGVATVVHLSRCGKYDTATSQIKAMIAEESRLLSAKLDHTLIRSCVQVLLSVEKKENIQGYHDLLGLLYKCLQQDD